MSFTFSPTASSTGDDHPDPESLLALLVARLPDHPITDRHLMPVAVVDPLGDVYVPTGDPDTNALADDVDGEILQFWVECDAAYIKWQLTAEYAGLGWRQTEKVPFDYYGAPRVEKDLEADYRRIDGGEA